MTEYNTPEVNSLKWADIFSSALTIVIATSIFYVAGWVYITHWYGFYGLDASYINLPIELILIHGIPAILTSIVTGLLSLVLLALIKGNIGKGSISKGDYPTIIALTYLIAAIETIALLYLLTPNKQASIEANVGIGGLILLFIGYVVIPDVWDWFHILLALLAEIRFEKARKSAPEKLEKAKVEMKKKIENFEQSLSSVSKFGTTALLIFYFLVSISTSAIFGEWDASRGGRLMVGDWHIPEVSMFSASSIPALEKFENKVSAGFEYKSLGLLLSDDKVYYLVDQKASAYYTTKPKVYIIPRNDDLILNFIVTPFVYSTATPLPTNTPTPTFTPAIPPTITPTP